MTHDEIKALPVSEIIRLLEGGDTTAYVREQAITALRALTAPVSDVETREHVAYLIGHYARPARAAATHIEKLARENAALRAEVDALRIKEILQASDDEILAQAEPGDADSVGESFRKAKQTVAERAALAPPAQASAAEIEKQCAHVTDKGECVFHTRTWAPDCTPTRCPLCPAQASAPGPMRCEHVVHEALGTCIKCGAIEPPAGSRDDG